MSQSQDFHVNYSCQPHTPTPRRYPSTLTLGHPQQTHHKYEGFEELLRQAGYKETRVFTPPREPEHGRLSPKPKQLDRGDAANSKSRLGGVVGFLAGLIPKSTTPTPDPTTSASATPTTMPHAPPSPASIQSSGCASDDEVPFDSPTTIKTIVPPLPTQQEIRRMGSTTTLNSQHQPKYLRSQHLQAKRQFSDAATGLMPPQPPIPNHHQLHQRHSYSHLNHPSRPASPSPLSRPGTPHRPTTPHRHLSHSRTSSTSHVTPFHPAPLYPVSKHSRPTTPAPVRAPTPSKAHAYLRHMASARGLAVERDDGEDTPRPLPRTIAPKSKSTSSSGSGSSSSRSGSQTSSATTVDLESSSSDEEDTGTYLRRMRSLSRTGSRYDEPSRTRVEAKSNWEKAMETIGGRRILRHSQSNTSATSSTTSKPMTDQTNRQSFAPPSRPMTPYLVTRLSSTEQSKGRGRDGRETRVNVYCRSRSVPPPRSRKRRGQSEPEAHVAPVMVLHDAFIGSNAPVPSVCVDSPEEEPSTALDTSTHAPQPQRQNSIRSLRRHLHSASIRDPDVPPLPIADRKSWSVRTSSTRERSAVEGLWG
ncbi:hypothetical protein WG66_003519 [Moniliophthora roreri]|uniref:Uncharacterized protein n=1 Tax=Moniliophthora roreri TaxID=221103 RepID=A0A0W0FM73_MONRR|nr:hypothetical protein WG66_003519 [Moniliophthora roreri]